MKIAVLLSGGVDSSVALYRLKEAGYTDIKAFYLKIWLEDDVSYLGLCPWEEDLSYAQAVCDSLGIELEVVPLQTQYYDRVVSYTLEELKKGNTPSPDIFCNERVKFGAFFEEIDASYTKVASGHYARLAWVNSKKASPYTLKKPQDLLGAEDPLAGTGEGYWALCLAPDPVKDQTYFLSHLHQTQLGRILFPVGDLMKSQVRDYAQSQALATQNRPDSQGICFLGKIKYPDFVRFYLGEKNGHILDASTGKILGEHKGTWFHTLGQRSGLSLGNGPWYVCAKDMERNVVYVRHGKELELAKNKSIDLKAFNWICGRAPEANELEYMNQEGLRVKLRHGPQRIACTLEQLEEDRYHLVLEEGDSGAAPGQFGVLYLGEECLGSGTIQAPDEANLEDLWTLHQTFLKEEEALALAREAAKKEKRLKRRERYKQTS